MKEVLDYLEEMIGDWYLRDTEARGEVPINIHTDEIYLAPEDQLEMAKLPEGGKRDYIERICKANGKTLDDYLFIKACCPFHGDYEVFRPVEANARYNNIFCPTCIRHEQILVDCERYHRQLERNKAEKKADKEKGRK